MKKEKLIIACDFDGTICDHQFPAIGPPMEGAFETLKRFIEKGDRLILWTCREGMFLKEAINFCKAHGVEFEEHNNNAKEHDYSKSRKIYASIYIDDRMIGGFPGWDVIEKHIDELREQLAYVISPAPIIIDEDENVE